MQKIKRFLFGIAFLSFVWGHAQRVDLKGQLVAEAELEGLHIQNKTAAEYTISQDDGHFIIPAKASDTLIISGVQYKKQEVIITASMVALGQFEVFMEKNVSELDEVVVGKIFTGSLTSDIENLNLKPEVNFYDLGIPGYTGKPLTQNERKLYDADAGAMVSLLGGTNGLGPSVNLHKLLNSISGRTKKLKAIVELDKREGCINRLKRDYETFLFENVDLAENLRTEYFLFCQEDERFLELCQENNDIVLIEFLQEKLKVYQGHRKSFNKE
ncbi:hypothetical protein [Winogradskyella arenosi]|uniref:Carboxypeptidase-like protein n=1 Tax=Winogradskyella arenosi TaxID=533325 RepID=A0A368ZGW4_9FLAO|nr:hypothetical protein [Winogradskyella arenosi]RCW90192.1 hypothetical protein DFQ08_10581 [Winogradskyella arenosi]